MIVETFLLAVLQTPPRPKAILWEKTDDAITAEMTSVFLVCVDGQPTNECTQVPVSAGTASTEFPGEKSFRWEIPALKPGEHRVSVQSCSLNANYCSPGATVKFELLVAQTDVIRLRLGGAQ